MYCRDCDGFLWPSCCLLLAWNQFNSALHYKHLVLLQYYWPEGGYELWPHDDRSFNSTDSVEFLYKSFLFYLRSTSTFCWWGNTVNSRYNADKYDTVLYLGLTYWYVSPRLYTASIAQMQSPSRSSCWSPVMGIMRGNNRVIAGLFCNISIHYNSYRIYNHVITGM